MYFSRFESEIRINMENSISINNSFPAEMCNGLFLNENYADFYFVLNHKDGQKRIPAHKLVLRMTSNEFATMFNGQWIEEHEVVIKDASYDGFVEFLQFLYLSQVKVTAENVCEVIYLANKYNVDKCIKSCTQQIKKLMTVDDVCVVLNLADKCNLNELKEYCLEKISDETSKVLNTAEFLNCTKSSLKNILAIDFVDCKEIDMFNACIKWAKHVCEVKKKDSSVIANVREELSDCLHAIRFGAMESYEISNCVANYKGLFSHIELHDILMTIGCYSDRVTIFKQIHQRVTSKWSHREMFLLDVSDSSKSSFYCKSLQNSTSFLLSKPLLFGKISLTPIYNQSATVSEIFKADLFVFEILHNKRKKILQQEFDLIVNSKSDRKRTHIKFKKAIKVKANVEYQVRIEKKRNDKYDFSGKSVFCNIEKPVSDGIVFRTLFNFNHLIEVFYFN